ncbi:AcvB/VirJ family lysyl-phosphatidylglycerol hydrolase [Paenirhodobacter sp.]|uniref:AcvB/VirJ family lysyl-phosphatidylglycerol hydrolase n=1 Tax=Paenirhodobacter sp. TaxID=1965326 RepID=UPI003B3FD1D0
MKFVLALALMAGAAAAQPPAGYDAGMIVGPHVFHPAGQPTGVVFLISDAQGWTADDTARAGALAGQGVAVVGLDLPGWLAALERHPDDDDCSYAIADIEELSKRLQAGGSGDYHLPLIAGRGDGGGLAVALAAQTPASTLAGAVAVDPSAGIALRAPLCTEAPHHPAGGREVYGLMPDGQLNMPVSVVFTPAAPADAQAHVAELARDYPGVSVTQTEAAPADALDTAVRDRLAARAEGPLNLPLTEMAVEKPALDTVAIIWSGDGGWRDIDSQVGGALQAAGVPVVGVDALRYFWNERKPQETAADLARIIHHYQGLWGVRHVLLIGYSFGADILPNSYNLLDAGDRASVAQMTLLGLSHQRDYVIHVSGWLGLSSGSASDPTKDLEQVPARIVQCIYGDGDDEDACHELAGHGYEMIGLPGGHHFDGDYQGLTQHILTGLRARLN